ncbi:hypothetical protein [Bifidobacterium choloepi]|uniref:Uncharacterized protein n=1 Tax=Bifidobacterium choloepi TaxID=2614131 RepID=A0A6I5NCB1_9BIFI|nr:hypothetical protein [Bifidobacterium choloepi]NEG69134.1 hypothetical protein [Bifidobacterium choloepi]
MNDSSASTSRGHVNDDDDEPESGAPEAVLDAVEDKLDHTSVDDVKHDFSSMLHGLSGEAARMRDDLD